MRPTRAPEPDGGMPAEYGMYGDYEEYDEDDFFYHMYFGEVLTTPLPDEFYESVSAGGNTQNTANSEFSNYPDYFDYLLNTRAKDPSDSDDNDEVDEAVTDSSERQSKNNRYLQLGRSDITTKSSNSLRRNSKFRRLKHRKKSKGAADQSALVPSRRNSKVMNYSEHLSSETVKSSHLLQRQNNTVIRSKRAASKNNRTPKPKKWNRNKWIRLRDRKRKKLERKNPRIIGILDRRIPTLFRQNPFVTISLAKFVVLSTGVTTGTWTFYF